MCGTQWNDIISNIVFIRMFFTLFSNRMISFFTLQCELFLSCNVSNNASLVSARTGGGGWSTKCRQAWKGGGGGAKIPKLVRTSFMDDPTAKRCKRKLDSIILFFFNVCYMNKQPPVVFLKISQNLQESNPVEMSYFQ